MFLLSLNLCPVVKKNSRISITLWKANLLMALEGEFVAEALTSTCGITAVNLHCFYLKIYPCLTEIKFLVEVFLLFFFLLKWVVHITNIGSFILQVQI